MHNQPNDQTKDTHHKDTWRQSLGAALDKASPVGAKLVNSLGALVLGGEAAPAQAIAMPAGGTAGFPAPDLNAQLNGWTRDLKQSIARPARIGIWTMVVFVFGLGTWTTTAPLSSAVVAHGSFVATGQNKIIQHLEGGIIARILAAEGDKVTEGQALVELDDTNSHADEQRLTIKQATLLATKARLDAERNGETDLSFPEQLQSMAGNPEVAKSISAQHALFVSRQTEFEGQRDLSQGQVKAIEQEIIGLNAQRTSALSQLEFLTKETETATRLLDKGLSEQSRVLELRRTKAKTEGDIGQFLAEIGRAEQRILQAKSELAHLHSKMISDGAELYRETTADLSDTEQRLTAAKGVLSRHIIRAPVNGVIVKLNFHTAGGVIPPGQVVAEVLPTDAKLIVEAMVRPEEIDFVHTGQPAEVRLSALNQRTTPLVQGTVVYVSADKIQNPSARSPGSEYFYLARVELDEASVKERIGKLKISPGMPGEVYVKTGERTMWQYLTRPIVDVMWHGAREK
jgi:HlyD family type I secretion membrane fusion protein